MSDDPRSTRQSPPDNGTQVFPTRKALACAHTARGRAFEDLDVSLALSDMGKHVSDRDVHASMQLQTVNRPGNSGDSRVCVVCY